MGPSLQKTGRGRLRELDALRGVAVLLVLGHHMGSTPAHIPAVGQVALDAWQQAGWVGVDLFFVLSGFLVSGLLFHEYQLTGNASAGRFLIRRGFKIYPAFYVFLLVTILVDRLLSRPASLRQILSEALFVQNYGTPLWNHTWSLAVEEHFYLLLALMVAVAIASTKRRGSAADPFRFVIPAFVTVALVALALRVVTALVAPPRLALHLTPTHLRVDSLLFGVLLSYLFHFHRGQLSRFVHDQRGPILCASVLALAPALVWPVTSRLMQTIGFTLLYLGFGGVLLLVLHRTEPSPATSRRALLRPVMRGASATLAWLGVYSYSIYLWHMAVQTWTAIGLARLYAWTPSPALEWTMYLVDSVVVGVIMAKLVETPGLAMRDRLIPARVQPESRLRAGIVGETTSALPLAELSQGETPSVIAERSISLRKAAG